MEIATMSQAMQLHAQVLKSGGHNHHNAGGGGTEQQTQQYLSKLFAFTALSPSGDLSYARLIFNTLQTTNSYYYNTIIRAYSDQPDATPAISLFLAMHRNPSTRPDKFTFPFVLKACSKARRTRLGKQLHGLVWKSGLGLDTYISNALIHMYSGGGVWSSALKVFDEMPQRDVVSWATVIDGLVDNEEPTKAIALFEKMMENGIEFNEVTVVSVLRACADSGALGIGRKVHDLIKEKKIGLNGKVSTALIDMYAKCWCIDGAKGVFNDAANKDVIAWTAMISGLAIHGMGKEAMECFGQMRSLEIKPDERILAAVLSACRNERCVPEGLECFRTMKKKYKVRPTMQHYRCMVDMLAQTGHLEDAEVFIQKMPFQPDTAVWRTLIRACELHGDMERAEHLMKHLEPLKMDFPDSESCLVPKNLPDSEGKWQEKGTMNALTNEKVLKAKGCSRMEIDARVHEFTTGDLRHFEEENIGGKLDEIALNLIRNGYHPKSSELLLDIDDGEKSFELRHHSEKLAVYFALIRTSPGATIRIVKNLRPCEDCHSFMKLVSNVYEREIIVRDHIRVHHFRKGECSCGNFW